MSQEQSTVIELINGMQEIKMHNAEKQKALEWGILQARLFWCFATVASLEQTFKKWVFIGHNEILNIFISPFTSALLCDRRKLHLGMMLSVQYIIGS